MEQKKKKLTITELNRFYTDSDSVDKTLFVEQRSNVLLASGDHFTKKHSRYWGRLRDSQQLNDETKLRITKNHIHRICNIYTNNIFSLAPGVAIYPKNERELHDQKVAELHSKVWSDFKERHRLRERVRDLCDDFVKVGEVAWKVFWDPNIGELIGYAQATDEEGNPSFDEMGQPLASDTPVFSGDFAIDPIFAPNLLRDPNSKNIYDSYVIYRKMASLESLKSIYQGDEEKLSFIEASKSDEFVVFDATSGEYEKSKEQCMIREFYFPKCHEYPNGYYYITTDKGILEEGELPFGVFPIIFDGFDSIPTTPRKRSIIKQLRPVQAELNRAASAMATQQITLGDDKLLIQSGTGVTQSSKLPGVRALTYMGAPPQVLPGRSGEQYLGYIQAQQEEMYVIANLTEELAEKVSAQADPMAELYKAIRHKKKYSLYAEKIELFLKRVCEIVLELSKHYYTDERLSKIFGPNELGNIAEFRREKSLGFEIRMEPQSDDVETKMGKHIELTNIIQYVGSNLDKESVGRIIRQMPFLTKDDLFEDFTTSYDNLTNDILALDRGEVPNIHPKEDHAYAIKRLTARTKQPDFKFLDPQIQQNYANYIGLHEEMEVEQLQLIKQAQAEFIPTGGFMAAVDFWEPDPNDPTKTKRLKLPSDAIAWLKKQLESQGTALDQLEQMQQGAVADVASRMISEKLGVPGTPTPNAPQGMTF